MEDSKENVIQIVSSFEDWMVRLLFICGLLSLILGVTSKGLEEGWVEGVSILMTVEAVVIVTSCNLWLKEHKYKKLNSTANLKNVSVIRHDRIEKIDERELLVGDIQIVESGETISADGFLLESQDLTADESSLTGEPYAIEKGVPSWEKDENINPFLISGSTIIEGSGKMLVLAVG